MFKQKSNQQGASLIEVMVSVFIFAVGVLGFASLQSRSLQATFDNGQRDQVVWLTQSLVDRVRLNAGAATNYMTGLDEFDVADCPTSDPAPLCDEEACTAAEMVTFDIWDLYCRNDFQGANAIKGLVVDFTCINTDGGTSTCAATETLRISTSWCSRGVETDDAIALGTSTNDCDKTIAQMSYTVDFRP